ncbi:MAG: hypothetical protein HY718_06760 [Planctomycetes bacterium]|nr:hypothetical protein [Planctomycetota bacterium]
MRRTMKYAVGAVLAGGVLALTAGCAATETKSGHEMASAQEGGHAMGCKMCYDRVVAVRQEHGKGAQWSTNKLIRKHACEVCKGDMTIYTDDKGTPMVKCPKCAPEGVACDKCLPPKSPS